MEKINQATLIRIFAKMADDLEAAKDQLTDLDAAVGDGDQGVTMTIGFRAIRDILPTLEGHDIGSIIARCGMTFNSKAASTIGAIFATGCMRAGREAKGKNEIGLDDLVVMFNSAIAGIKERGKAELGDKTVLDMLAPTVESLRKSSASGEDLFGALDSALVAAEEGVKSTIPMKSKIGRASWLSERSVGHQDPGATSFYLMLKSAISTIKAEG